MSLSIEELATRDELLRRRAQAVQQQHRMVLTPAPLAVLACPGAGKTRTIVDRHLKAATPAGRGRAIASFTRVAATEIRRRALAERRADLLQHPHAVMTLDAFFFRFLVRPFLNTPTPENPRTWTHIDSWDRAPRELRTVVYQADHRDASTQRKFSLSSIQFEHSDGNPGIVAARPRERWAKPWNSLTDNQVQAALKLADDARHQLVWTHRYVTGIEVRAAALHYLAQYGDLVGATLPNRFCELVVDEVQDCSSTDVDILLKLQDLGLPLVVVGDPDQAIYGFRDQGDQGMERLVEALPPQAVRLNLTGNWRSSAAVCGLAATLRQDPCRQVPDDALSAHHDLDLPVHLVPRDDDTDTDVDAYHRVADAAGIPRDSRLILAHGAETLPGIKRGSKRAPADATAALMWAVGVLRHSTPGPRRRADALATLETALIRYWFSDADTTSSRDWSVDFHVDRLHLRRLVAAALTELPALSLTGTEWCAQARVVLSALRPEGAAGDGANIVCPRGGGSVAAIDIVGLTLSRPDGDDARADLVHQVKGDEADAVLLLLPDEERTGQLLAAWAARAQQTADLPAPRDPKVAEPLRVLYVAVTRARRLVTIAIPVQHLAAIAGVLRSRGVPIAIS